MTTEDRRLANLLRHVNGVQEGCLILGQRLIESGEEQLGRTLIANGRIHDHSKFFGIEWETLNDGAWPRDEEAGRELFKAALHQHVTTNPHHPEYWPGGIKEMSRVYLAEALVDWYARSAEQGTDLMEWVREKATEKFGFSTNNGVYRELKHFADLLLEKRFK